MRELFARRPWLWIVLLLGTMVVANIVLVWIALAIVVCGRWRAAGCRRIRPSNCSTAVWECSAARLTRMYANGQSHPSASARWVMTYLTGQESSAMPSR